MKRCPYCAEEIQQEAIKCKHCGEFFDGRSVRRTVSESDQSQVSWFFKPASVILSILTVGPLALPIVWAHPTYSPTKKIVITVIVLVVTYYLVMAGVKAWNSMMDIYKGILPNM